MGVRNRVSGTPLAKPTESATMTSSESLGVASRFVPVCKTFLQNQTSNPTTRSRTQMASLPVTPFVLHGGCFCKAITYTISVPSLGSRPLIPNPPKRPFGPQNQTMESLPIITLDHCNSCRRIPGAIVDCWFVCPQPWATFSLLSRALPESRITSSTTAEVLRPTKELEDATFVRGFESSEHAHRTFCGKCGTHLSFYYSGEDDDMAREENWGPHFDVAVGTFEKESVEMEGMRPGSQGWWDEGIGWVKDVLREGEKGLRV